MDEASRPESKNEKRRRYDDDDDDEEELLIRLIHQLHRHHE